MRPHQSLHGSYSPFKSGKVRQQLGWTFYTPGKVQGTPLSHLVLSLNLLRNLLLLQLCLLARPDGVKRIQQCRERSPTVYNRRNSWVAASQFKREQQVIILLPFFWSCFSICIFFFFCFLYVFQLIKKIRGEIKENGIKGNSSCLLLNLKVREWGCKLAITHQNGNDDNVVKSFKLLLQLWG